METTEKYAEVLSTRCDREESMRKAVSALLLWTR